MKTKNGLMQDLVAASALFVCLSAYMLRGLFCRIIVLSVFGLEFIKAGHDGIVGVQTNLGQVFFLGGSLIIPAEDSHSFGDFLTDFCDFIGIALRNMSGHAENAVCDRFHGIGAAGAYGTDSFFIAGEHLGHGKCLP